MPDDTLKNDPFDSSNEQPWKPSSPVLNSSADPDSQPQVPPSESASPKPKPTRDYAAMGRKGGLSKSEHGRAISARNATKHGLSAQSFVLLGTENKALYEAHRAQFYAALQPVNAVESAYVDRMIDCSWLIQRANEMESASLTNAIEVQRNKPHAEGSAPADSIPESLFAFFATEKLTTTNATFDNLNRYRSAQERTLLRFHKQLLSNRANQPSSGQVIHPSELSATPSLFLSPPKKKD